MNKCKDFVIVVVHSSSNLQSFKVKSVKSTCQNVMINQHFSQENVKMIVFFLASPLCALCILKFGVCQKFSVYLVCSMLVLCVLCNV
jgi:hypothetical protein